MSESKLKKVAFQGLAPVDTECARLLGKAQVYCEGNNVWDAMLNQTNLQFNNNKYYLLQLLQETRTKKFYVWLRWGRVGKSGQNNLIECGLNLDEAKEIFTKKFFAF